VRRATPSATAPGLQPHQEHQPGWCASSIFETLAVAVLQLFLLLATDRFIPTIVGNKIADDWKRPSPPAIEAALQKFAFAPLGATEKESVGWVSPRPQDHSPLLEVVNGQWILKLQTESKSVPPRALKAALEAKCKKLEAETGRPVSATRRRS